MSDQFVRRLERIHDELAATSEALASVSLHWNGNSLYNFPALETVDVEDVHRAAEDLESMPAR